MTIEVNPSDEGNCRDWTSFFTNKSQCNRGLALATRSLGDPIEAQDVVQDAWLRVSPHPDIQDKPNYFLKTVENLCRSRLRKRSRLLIVNALPLDGPSRDDSKEAPMEIEDCKLDPEMDLERKEKTNQQRRIVAECLETLTNREKELFYSRLNGDTHLEIAVRSNEDVTLIRVETNRILAKMRYRCRNNDKQQGQ